MSATRSLCTSKHQARGHSGRDSFPYRCRATTCVMLAYPRHYTEPLIDVFVGVTDRQATKDYLGKEHRFPDGTYGQLSRSKYVGLRGTEHTLFLFVGDVPHEKSSSGTATRGTAT